jgi:hypothetical protein
MIRKYKIANYEAFENGFLGLVDTSVDYSKYKINPWVTKADYFGKLKWGKFTIYQQPKYLFKRRIFLKIDGAINDNQLSLKINFHYFYWVAVVNSIFLGLLSVFIMTQLPIYYGIILLIINIFQTFRLHIFCNKIKCLFINQIEEIIKNAA